MTHAHIYKQKLTNQPPRIAGICVHLDSWQLLSINIAHLIENGITDFFLMDHASESDHSAAVIREFSPEARIRYFRKSSLPFYQGVMTGFLVDQARAQGFDIALVFDADEFFSLRDTEDHRTLSEVVVAELTQYSHTRVPIVDYLPHVSTLDVHTTSVQLLRPRISKRDVTIYELRIFGFSIRVTLKDLKKTVFWIAGYRAGDAIELGNHYAPGSGRDSQFLVVRHVPVSHPGALAQRRRQTKNLSSVRLPGRSAELARQKDFNQLDSADGDFMENWSWSETSLNCTPVDISDEAFVKISARAQKFLSGDFFLGLNAKKVIKPMLEVVQLSGELDKAGLAEVKKMRKVSRRIKRMARAISRVNVRLSI